MENCTNFFMTSEMVRYSLFTFLTCLSIFSVCEGGFRPIVNGENVEITEVPYTAHITFYTNESIKNNGGAVIIAAKTVLTAAHICRLWNEATSVFVHVGSTSVSSGGQNLTVENVINHPNYNRDTKDYDFCIVKLESAIDFDETKQPAMLPEPDEEIPDGDLLMVLGWGGTLNEKRSEILQKVILPKISQTKCQVGYKAALTERMFCALKPKAVDKTHHGDSGGPVISLTDNKLHGLVSWGALFKHVVRPSVFARVSSVVDWIQQNMS